jgi:DNA repair protein RecO (recombination protein O)
MTLYRDTGIVLRTMRLGEADRIVTFLTAGRGKVRAVAKGVRKTKSRFGGRLEPMNHVALLLYEGRELDVVTQADTIEQFRSIREDLDRVGKATALLEAADQLAQERHEAARLHAMLLGALRALSARDAPLLVPAFFLKLLSLEGFHPLLDACAGCGADAPYDLVAFDVGEGGALCRLCAGRISAVAVSPDGLDLVRGILGGGLGAALAEPASRATAEVDKLATRALEHHLERRLRSIAVLDRG